LQSNTHQQSKTGCQEGEGIVGISRSGWKGRARRQKISRNLKIYQLARSILPHWLMRGYKFTNFYSNEAQSSTILVEEFPEFREA
jgi:hypothetical protein